MKLYRSRNGVLYHREGCHHARREMVWAWAQGRSEREVWETWEHGVYPCRVCRPLGDKNTVRP